MRIVGVPNDWADLINPMVPEILSLVIASWEEMPAPASDEKEDNITIALCRALRQNRDARNLMFQIDTQVVELEPAPGEDLGRLDIAFRPLIPREDIYFCLETEAPQRDQRWPDADICLGICQIRHDEVRNRPICQGSTTWGDDRLRARRRCPSCSG